jgi:hypothetical protein
MGEILGLGLSHYPGPMVPAEDWPRMLETNVQKGRIPRDLFEDRARWPAAMLAEWGQDDGVSAAREHERRLLGGYRELRRRLDEFNPDLVVVWGDDQYENFRTDGVPAFCIYIFDEIVSHPFAGGGGPFRTERNAWNLPADTPLVVKGHREAAEGLMRSLLAQDFDPAYAFDVRFERGLSHAFAYTALFLDRERTGFPYPMIPFHVNCYGNQMMRTAARIPMVCPPSPSPRRCFAIGAATARYFRDSPWRVALIGSSSWSHGSLTQKHDRLYPDVAADGARYDDLRCGNFAAWRDIALDQIEDSGQNEFLNWICLAGAMSELGYRAEVVDYVESCIFNSSKCFAVFTPAEVLAER